MPVVPQRANLGSIPPEVIRFERRVATISKLRGHLPSWLQWIVAPLSGKLAHLQSESLNAADKTSNMAKRQHAQICRDGGYALVNGRA